MTTAIPAEAFEHGDPARYHRGCRCQLCKTGITAYNRHKKYLRETGRGTLRTTTRAAAHVTRLRQAGMSDHTIMQTARISPDILYRVTRGEGHIRLSSERRILAVPVPQAAEPKNYALIDANGTWRRLQALAVAGWTAKEIASRIGAHPTYVAYVMAGGGGGRIAIRTAQMVSRIYRELWDQRPEDHGTPGHIAERARRSARKKGWHPAAVWDDIDNPAEQPNYGELSPRALAIVEDAGELIRQGLSREAVAERLGVSWNTVAKAYSRNRMPIPAVAA